MIYWIGMSGGGIEFADQHACEAALKGFVMAETVFQKGGFCTPKKMCPDAGEDSCALRIAPKG